jgi:hypothetical protein
VAQFEIRSNCQISNHVWSVEELCGLLPETASTTKRIDKGLILKALGEQAS